jgi:hypothetical protein
MNQNSKYIQNIILNTICDYKELIHDSLDHIDNLKKLNFIDNNIINSSYDRINRSIKNIIRLQNDLNYSCHEELMKYFYHPDVVFQFLLLNPNKHVEHLFDFF